MTRLYKSILNVKSADIGPESSLPPLFTVNTRDPDMPSDLPEEDGLYLKYEFLKSIFPYRFQDNYNREYTIPTTHVVKIEGATGETRIEVCGGNGGHPVLILDDILVTKD